MLYDRQSSWLLQKILHPTREYTAKRVCNNHTAFRLTKSRRYFYSWSDDTSNLIRFASKPPPLLLFLIFLLYFFLFLRICFLLHFFSNFIMSLGSSCTFFLFPVLYYFNVSSSILVPLCFSFFTLPLFSFDFFFRNKLDRIDVIDNKLKYKDRTIVPKKILGNLEHSFDVQGRNKGEKIVPCALHNWFNISLKHNISPNSQAHLSLAVING